MAQDFPECIETCMNLEGENCYFEFTTYVSSKKDKSNQTEVTAAIVSFSQLCNKGLFFICIFCVASVVHKRSGLFFFWVQLRTVTVLCDCQVHLIGSAKSHNSNTACALIVSKHNTLCFWKCNSFLCQIFLWLALWFLWLLWKIHYCWNYVQLNFPQSC